MKRRNKQPVFGAKGTKMIEYLGEMPKTFGPFVTLKTYRFRPGKNPRLVDVRDLSLLAKAAGRENLRDVNDPESVKPKQKTKPRPIEVEEVDDGTDRNTDG